MTTKALTWCLTLPAFSSCVAISQPRKSWAEAQGCLQVFRKRWCVTPAALPRFPCIVSGFVREHSEMRDCYFLISFIFFYFFGQVWCWMETDALFRTWWGRKTQLRVNTLLVFIHKYGIVQEHQIHMEHCDWLLLMSFLCHSEVISMSPTRWTDQLSLFVCINSISQWHIFRALLSFLSFRGHLGFFLINMHLSPPSLLLSLNTGM